MEQTVCCYRTKIIVKSGWWCWHSGVVYSEQKPKQAGSMECLVIRNYNPGSNTPFQAIASGYREVECDILPFTINRKNVFDSLFNIMK